MIVFDLRCAGEHVFEAWFGSSESYDDQRARGLIACPVCGVTTVEKALMAPRLSTSGLGSGSGERSSAEVKAMLGALASAQAKALASSRWVGDRFAVEARAMHEGERTHEPIHGRASLADARALADDGVPVAPLPLPVVPPDQAN